MNDYGDVLRNNKVAIPDFLNVQDQDKRNRLIKTLTMISISMSLLAQSTYDPNKDTWSHSDNLDRTIELRDN